MASPYDEYMNKRSWLIDTAETPADKKNLKAQLAKLDAEYKAKSKTGTQPGHAVTTPANNTKPVAPVGAAAIAVLQHQVSPAGVKQAAVNAKSAIDKKYPGLYNK